MTEDPADPAPRAGASSPRPRRTRGTDARRRASAREPLYSEDDLPRVVIEKVHEVEPLVYPVELDDARVDDDAAKVVKRLVRHGYEAYLVGGCVRDLLVGRSPKDFDVATSARPDDVRRLFRNSRIIGRRFRLVHVLFGGGKVIETATFRRAPEQGDAKNGEELLIRNDNVFGEAHEDALRRDLRINGLFYDLEARRVLDWVDGMPDIQQRTVRTIGDPTVRFLEDPVRILRAIKFSARLDFGISPEVYDAIVQCRGSLAMAARPRLFEELLRLLRGGAAHRSIWLAWETGVLDVLLPELSAFLSDAQDDDGAAWRILSAIDRLTLERGAPFDDVVLCTALLLEPMREACAGERDRMEAAFEFLEPVGDRLNIPRRIADSMRRIVALLPRLEGGRTGRFTKTPIYPLAMDVLELSQLARELGARADGAGEERAGRDADDERATARAPSKRRRRRPRRTDPPES
ncbi:MAG: polynucleotide adenylyltransferase PcnB [Sorangiineae bacterium]|nr:polynucleotide adenylyltransferase PcnB [Polyangiaceae bacterium]MEB2324376.1 polynucleotide adenylyltransferase PcnB [Sorangiineae bacterium]